MEHIGKVLHRRGNKRINNTDIDNKNTKLGACFYGAKKSKQRKSVVVPPIPNKKKTSQEKREEYRYYK